MVGSFRQGVTADGHPMLDSVVRVVPHIIADRLTATEASIKSLSRHVCYKLRRHRPFCWMPCGS